MKRMTKDIRKMIFANTEYAIVFSIVWTILNGIFVLLGAKDYSLSDLLILCIGIAICCTFVLNATTLLLFLFEKVKFDIRNRKEETKCD